MKLSLSSGAYNEGGAGIKASCFFPGSKNPGHKLWETNSQSKCVRILIFELLINSCKHYIYDI